MELTFKLLRQTADLRSHLKLKDEQGKQDATLLTPILSTAILA